ncbi:MAG: hypothetical protein IJ848_04090 [Alphaproteobacteria bacterium]|nr:hypothetical protein [Alphaproteobacteria bacterium]
MFFNKILNILPITLLAISSHCIASENSKYYTNSFEKGGIKFTLMSHDGHENDVLFPRDSEDDNAKVDEKKEVRIEFEKDNMYKVVYNNRVNTSTHDLNLLPIFLDPYIKVSSISEKIVEEMHFPYEEFIPVFTDCKKMVFDKICSTCNDFDCIIKNNSGESLGIIFNLSNDFKCNNIYLNNIDRLTVNASNSPMREWSDSEESNEESDEESNSSNIKEYKFSYNNIFASPDSTLEVVTNNSKSVSRIEKK